MCYVFITITGHEKQIQTIMGGGRVRVMVFNTTINNISVMSWQSLLLVEYPEKTTDLPLVTVTSTPGHEWDSNLQL